MLYYEVEGEGKSFVFLHGFLENHSIWNNLRADLKDQHQIITLDLPGHGNSETDNEENTMEELADEVIAVLDVLNIAQASFVWYGLFHFWDKASKYNLIDKEAGDAKKDLEKIITGFSNLDLSLLYKNINTDMFEAISYMKNRLAN